MKKSIVYPGVALLAFTNVTLASNINSLSASKSIVSVYDGATPLGVAINKGDIEVVKKFIEYGSLVNISNAANVVDKQKKTFQAEILAENNISIGTKALKFYSTNRDSIEIEVIESVNTNKMEKTTDELFAEDNAIIESNISNETQALDFEIINRNSIPDEIIECVNLYKIEKTPEELITEDNAITENNLSNETKALDFGIINRNSNLLIGKNRSIRGYRIKL